MAETTDFQPDGDWVRVTVPDRSGTITTGGTAQSLMPAVSGNRRSFWVQNISNGDLWIDDTGAAAVTQQPSLQLPPGAYYEPAIATNGSISIIGATTGQAWSAREW